MMHGKTSTINIVHQTAIFRDMPSTFIATRYHSLVIENNKLSDNIIPTSFSTDDNEIMSIEIKDLKIYAVQFHPESILSEYGKEILNNFLKL
jgi:anthranilate synthase component 2